MPVVRITPPTQTVLNGTIAELVCDTTAGTPPFLFSRFLSSTDITVGVTSNTTTSTLLVDTAMMQTWSRSYTCRVTLDQPLPANQLSGTDVGTLLTDFPPVVSVNDVTGVASERIEIVCRVLSDPPPASNQVVVVLSSGMVVGPFSISSASGTPRTTIFSFQIQTADPALHAGPAVCRTRVTLDSGTEEVNGSFNIAFLVVMPVVRITPPTQTVLNGTIAELVCDTTAGTPPFLFSWFLSSTEITVGVTSNTTTSTLLVDTAMMQTRSRSYTCRVTLDQPLPANQLSATDVGTLLTDFPPVVSVNDVTGVAGERIEIVCRIRSDPPPASNQVVVVLSSGMVVGPFLVSAFSGPPRTTIFSFQIQTADPALHAGPAVCRTRVTLDSGTEEVNSSFNIAGLVVMPLVRITPPTQTVLNGTIAELVCDTTAGTPPFLFSWFLSSTEITVGVTSNATTSTLLVDTAMMQTRSRSYTCRVTLDQPLPANQLSGTDVGTLLTDFPPVVSVNDVTGVAGERIEIVCRIRSDPPPASNQVVVVLSSGMVVGPFSISVVSGAPPTTTFRFQIQTADPALHAGPAVCRTRVTLDSRTVEVNGSFNIAVDVLLLDGSGTVFRTMYRENQLAPTILSLQHSATLVGESAACQTSIELTASSGTLDDVAFEKIFPTKAVMSPNIMKTFLPRQLVYTSTDGMPISTEDILTIVQNTEYANTRDEISMADRVVLWELRDCESNVIATAETFIGIERVNDNPPVVIFNISPGIV
ncbi:uncharacterized protein LOC135821670 [Sycon ciliatum]|uniref:uncharacterized protein LOC135821670 n=1 Tax=Sycon ciliatum TaxID=27933 RepID=UPI0031F69F15